MTLHLGTGRPTLRRSLVVVGLAFTGVIAIAAQAQASTVVALWHMDETSGTVMHDAVGGNDGRLTDVRIGIPGVRGKAYAFNGSSSSIIVPSSDALNPGSSDFTVSLFVAFGIVPPPEVGDYDLVRKGFSGTSGGDWKVEILPVSNKGVASCYFRGSTGSATLTDSNGPNLADRKKHRITCEKLSGSIKLTVDDRTLTKTATVGTISNTRDVNIGFKDDPGNPPQDWYRGRMDEVIISKG